MPLRRRIAVQKTWATTPWEWHTGHNVLVMSMVIFEASNRKVEAVRGNVELGDVVDTLLIYVVDTLLGPTFTLSNLIGLVDLIGLGLIGLMGLMGLVVLVVYVVSITVT